MKRFNRIATTCAALGTLMIMGTHAPAHSMGSYSNAVFYGPTPMEIELHGYEIIQIASNPQQEAQSFIKNMGDDAIAFLSDDRLSQEQKTQRFRALLNEKFDMYTIGRFVLGSYWKQYNKSQQDEYQKHFKEMIISIYSDRLEEYENQTFEVTGVQGSGDNEYTVTSNIVSDNSDTLPVSWKLRKKNGSLKVIDVYVENVSMAITKRNEFSSIIQNNGGDPESLLTHMRQKEYQEQ